MADASFKSEASVQFGIKTAALEDAILGTLRDCEHLLRGAAGLKQARGDVSREEWRRYCTSLRFAETFPGIEGVGYSLWLAPSEKEAHIRQVRSGGVPSYDIFPAGERSAYSTVIHFEPCEGRSLQPLGYDMYSEPVRRAAMGLAMESSAAALSGKVVLAQESEKDRQSGVLLFLPVYREGMALATEDERREAIDGFVYSPIRTADLVHATLKELPKDLGFQNYDGTELRQEALLFESHAPENVEKRTGLLPPLEARRSLDVFGRRWTFRFFSRPGFAAESGPRRSDMVLGAGLLASTVLAGIAFGLQSRRERAVRLAHDRLQELVTAEARYQRLVETSPDAIAVLREGRFEYVNPSGLGLFGATTVAELIGRPILDRVHPESRPAVEGCVQAGLTGDSISQLEATFIRLDGSTVHVEMAGNFAGGVWSFRDVSERESAQRALRESAAKFRSYIEHAPVGVLVADTAGRHIESNRAADTMLGYEAGGLLQRHFSELLAPEDAEAGQRHFATVLESGYAEGTLRLRRQDGRVLWVNIRAVRISADRLMGIFLDLTQQMAAEASLRETLRFMREIEKIARVGGWKTNIDTNTLTWTDGVNHIIEAPLDYKPGLAEGLTVYLPEYIPALQQALRCALEQGTPFSLQVEVLTKCGKRLWVEVRGIGRIEEWGQRSVIGTFLDITDRKRVERDLEKARRNFDCFFNTIDALLFVLDTQGHIIHANRTACRRLGWTLEELLGQSVLTVHPPHRRDEAGTIVSEMLAGRAESCPVPLLTKAGTEIPVETRVVGGEWNDQPALFGVTKDISQLARSEEKFSRAFHSSPPLMAISTIESGRYLEVNEAFLTTLGFTREEVIGRTSLELGLHVDPQQRAEIRQRVEQSGPVRQIEVRVRAKTGAVHTGLFSATPIELGDQKCWLTTLTDVTDRKRMEEELRQSVEQKTALLKEIHHRVKNNLQIMTSLINLQSRRITHPEALGALTDTQARMRSMSLLHETLYRSGRMDRVEMAPYVRHLCVNLARILGVAGRGIELKVQASRFTMEVNQAVPCGLILNELISNAFKHAFPEGRRGEVLVEFSMEPGDTVLIRVADDGVGLPENLDIARSPTLGLTLVSDLAKQLRATWTVQRQDGSCFEIRFKPQQMAPAAALCFDGPNTSVL
jgi:PAS domain S-box-containing protein